MINKKLLAVSATIAACFTVSTFATELSPATIQTCSSYINNPTTQAGEADAAALQQCYENRDQLVNVPNSAHQLNQWKANYIPPQPQATTLTSPPPQPAPGTAIPPQFHSTNPSQPVVTPTYPTVPVSTAQPQSAGAAGATGAATTQSQPTQPAAPSKPPHNLWFGG